MGRRAWALLLVVGTFVSCSGGHTAAKPPTASVTATTLSAVEREVEAAYLKSWDVYADALRSLDVTRLPEAFADAALAATQKEIATLRDQGSAVKVSVVHDYRIQIIGPASAVVHDTPMNHSVLVDPTTGVPKEPDPNKQVGYDYTMKEHADSWRVTEVARRF